MAGRSGEERQWVSQASPPSALEGVTRGRSGPSEPVVRTMAGAPVEAWGSEHSLLGPSSRGSRW